MLQASKACTPDEVTAIYHDLQAATDLPSHFKSQRASVLESVLIDAWSHRLGQACKSFERESTLCFLEQLQRDPLVEALGLYHAIITTNPQATALLIAEFTDKRDGDAIRALLSDGRSGTQLHDEIARFSLKKAATTNDPEQALAELTIAGLRYEAAGPFFKNQQTAVEQAAHLLYDQGILEEAVSYSVPFALRSLHDTLLLAVSKLQSLPTATATIDVLTKRLSAQNLSEEAPSRLEQVVLRMPATYGISQRRLHVIACKQAARDRNFKTIESLYD
jgi:hypothetical protein